MVTSEPVSREITVIFTCGDEAFAVHDLLDAALIRGKLEPVWRELLRLLACEKRAADLDLKADESAIDAAAQSFRYRHDLITAEETEQWLEVWGIALGDFSDYFGRGFWGKVMHENVTPEPLDYLSAPVELRELLRVHLVLSGELTRIATRSSWRAASYYAAAAKVMEPQLIAEQEQFFLAREGLNKSMLPEFLARLERDTDWFAKQMSIEAVYHQHVEELLTLEARKRELATLRLPLTRFDLEIIEFDSRDAAREAFLCVRDDDVSMAEIASESRYPYRNVKLLLEEIDDELQQKFLSLSPGSVLEPIKRGDGFQLYKITGKHEPDREDPAIRARVDRRILDRHFTELATKHVVWHLTVNPTQ